MEDSTITKKFSVFLRSKNMTYQQKILPKKVDPNEHIEASDVSKTKQNMS